MGNSGLLDFLFSRKFMLRLLKILIQYLSLFVLKMILLLMVYYMQYSNKILSKSIVTLYLFSFVQTRDGNRIYISHEHTQKNHI